MLKTTRLPDMLASEKNNGKNVVIRFGSDNKELIKKLGKLKS